MKTSIILSLCLICSITIFSQEKMYIHKSDKISLGVLLTQTDSVYFSTDGSKIFFRIGTNLAQYSVSEIDSISFGANSNTISVIYNETSASVINPLAFEGVSVVVKGAEVTVTSTVVDKEINCSLKGTTSNGMFKIYSNYKYSLNLNGVNLTNADGPAINIQSKRKGNIILNEGTTNSLTDGSIYTASTEDQKSTLFSEGQLEFEGTGSLTVKSNSAHAICSDDYINIKSGTITISGASKDGIHSKDFFSMSGGTLNVTSNTDGVECESGYILISGGNIATVNNSADAKGLVCDSTLTITGGIINLTLGGNQSKGIKASKKMIFNGGDITINNSGGVVLQTSGSGYDPAFSYGIKGDIDIEISGSKITIDCSGAGGKGISSSGNISITSGTVNVTTSGAGAVYKNISGITDSYSATCLNSDGGISITGGEVTNFSSKSGGKGIKATGNITIGNSNSSPTLTLTTTGSKFLVSGTDYNHPKTMMSNGTITIINGTINISSSDDAIHSETSVVFNGGNTSISKSIEGIEGMYVYIKKGTLSITASNDAVNTTKGTSVAGSNDGSCLYISGGTLTANCTNGNAIDSDGNIEITGGTTIANGAASGTDEAVAFNGTFNMSGGLFIASGPNSATTKSMSTPSTQPNILISSTSLISSSTFLHIQDASGTDILTFKPKNGGYYFLFSSPSLTKGISYSIYAGGSYTGGSSFNGLYSGGTYSNSGATLKKTVALSTASTVSTISF